MAGSVGPHAFAARHGRARGTQPEKGRESMAPGNRRLSPPPPPSVNHNPRSTATGRRGERGGGGKRRGRGASNGGRPGQGWCPVGRLRGFGGDTAHASQVCSAAGFG